MSKHQTSSILEMNKKSTEKQNNVRPTQTQTQTHIYTHTHTHTHTHTYNQSVPINIVLTKMIIND